MDTGMGKFAEISEERAKKIQEALRQQRGMGHIDNSGIFHVGEELLIKGSKFRVQKINRNRKEEGFIPSPLFFFCSFLWSVRVYSKIGDYCLNFSCFWIQERVKRISVNGYTKLTQYSHLSCCIG